MSPLPGCKSWNPGIVVKLYDKPRSYIVRSGWISYLRNRKHLRSSTDKANAGNDFDYDDFGEMPDLTQTLRTHPVSPATQISRAHPVSPARVTPETSVHEDTDKPTSSSRLPKLQGQTDELFPRKNWIYKRVNSKSQ